MKNTSNAHHHNPEKKRKGINRVELVTVGTLILISNLAFREHFSDNVRDKTKDRSPSALRISEGNDSDDEQAHERNVTENNVPQGLLKLREEIAKAKVLNRKLIPNLDRKPQGREGAPSQPASVDKDTVVNSQD